MKQGTNLKRSRGRGGRKPGGVNRQHVFDSNGPSVRIRGSAMQIYEKYSQLSRDNMGNDRVASENMAQHAEHYFRVAQQQLQQQQQHQQQQHGHNNNGSAHNPSSHQGSQDRHSQHAQPQNPQPNEDAGHNGNGNAPVNGADRDAQRQDHGERPVQANGAPADEAAPAGDASADQPPRRPRRARPKTAKSPAKATAPADAGDGGGDDD